MSPSNIATGIDVAHAYIGRAESGLNALKIVPRTPREHRSDQVVLQLISKAFALSKASLALVESFPDEAFGLCRSLVECAIILRYLTMNWDEREKRAREFVSYADTDAHRWCVRAYEVFKGTPDEEFVREMARGLGVDPTRNPKGYGPTGAHGFAWEVLVTGRHPLDQPATEMHRRAMHHVDYELACPFVHCSQPSVRNYCPDERAEFRIRPSSGVGQQEGHGIPNRVVYYLHTCIGYGLFGLNLDWPAGLEAEHQAAREAIDQMTRWL